MGGCGVGRESWVGEGELGGCGVGRERWEGVGWGGRIVRVWGEVCVLCAPAEGLPSDLYCVQ